MEWDPIEITSEMELAGVAAMDEYGDVVSGGSLVRIVFNAMMSAAQGIVTEGQDPKGLGERSD